MNPVQYQPSPEDAQKNKYIAMLSYLGIFLLFPLLARRDSGFCRFHVNQGLVLLILNLIINFLSRRIGFIGILSIGTLILMIMGLVDCFQGKTTPLPLIGKIQLLR